MVDVALQDLITVDLLFESRVIVFAQARNDAFGDASSLDDSLDGTETRLRCSTSAGILSSVVLDAWVESSLPTTVADEFSSHAAAGTG